MTDSNQSGLCDLGRVDDAIFIHHGFAWMGKASSTLWGQP